MNVTAEPSRYPRARVAGARRRRARRVGAWLRATAWLLATAVVLSTLGTLLFLHRGDAEGGARVANREIDLLLQRGERVQRRVPVVQRHWWNYFRVTHGVLAATDRRLLYVGVSPGGLLPREPEPLEIEEWSLAYERPLEPRATRVFLGTRPGVQLTTDDERTTFGFLAADRPKVDSVLLVVAERQGAIRAAVGAERLATEAAIAAARRPIHHLVQRGEALDYIARRYGVPADSIRRWNGITGDRITAGRRLLVKPGT